MSSERAPRRDERLRAIVELVETAEHPLTVAQLAVALGVAAATIRRDTAALESQGVVARSWGRVGRPDGFIEQPLRARSSQRLAEKRRIAQAAAGLVHDGSLVGLTGGTTTLEVARAISGRQRLAVVTNSLSIGMQLAPRPNIRLVLSGGEARHQSFELSGPLSLPQIQAFNLDIAIIGVDGIDARRGATAYDHPEAITNAALVQQAARTVVAADSSKLGRSGFAQICGIEAIATLITDTDAGDEQVAAFERAGVEVICV